MVINSVAGFIIAFKTERSFRIHFAFGFVLPILLAILSQILGVTLHTWEWYAVIGFGVFLLTVELLNTGIEEAINVIGNSYSPYSHYKVAAAILTNKDTIIVGVNVENAAFGDTICAERTALTQAITQGFQPKDIIAIAVYSLSSPPASPCGTCRQVISELMNPNAIVYFGNETGERKQIFGKTNGGKSTLVNTLVGSKVAITSPRVQTTRDAIQGIYNDSDSQMIFVDTPGHYHSQHLLGKRMQNIIGREIKDAEVILYVVDGQRMDIDDSILSRFSHRNLILVINKVDLIAKEEILVITAKYQLMAKEIIGVSALHQDNCDRLIQVIKKYLPEGPMYYSPDDITNHDKTFMIKELIREATLLRLNYELPHSICIVIEYFDENEIRAQVICEKESQKKIIIGKEGSMIKEIRKSSEHKIKQFLGKKIKLELFVKLTLSAIVLSEIIDKLTYDNRIDSYIFKVFNEAIGALDKNNHAAAVLSIAIFKLLDEDGHGLIKNSCCICGGKSNIESIDLSQGGLICQQCRSSYSPRYSKEFLKSIYLLINANLENIPSVNSAHTKFLLPMLITHLEENCGIVLKSAHYIKEL
ncbi:gtpase era [Holotrichia oblita]|nr:gtpase era [Holotrichia oblita]